MKNKPYPLNIVLEIKNLKEFALYCVNTYKSSITFQFEQNNEVLKISFQEFWNDINALGTMLYKLG